MDHRSEGTAHSALEMARARLARAAGIADNLSTTPDAARLMIEVAREYREIAMAQSYLTTDPLRWMGDESSEGRAEPEPLPLVPEAASISMVRELEEINNRLHEAGFPPPYGAHGVRNLLRLYGAFVGPHVKQAGPSPAPLVPEAAELTKINKLLREAGFEYPVGARGVKDVLHMRREDLAELDAINETLRTAGIRERSGADGVRDLVRVCHALGGGCPPDAPGSVVALDLSASQGPEIPVGGLDDLRAAESDGADASPGADEVCTDLVYRDVDGREWRRVADHKGAPIMRQWSSSVRAWGPTVMLWADLVDEYGPVSRGDLL